MRHTTLSSRRYPGFKPLRPGAIHLVCPRCQRKMSNVPRDKSDPPTAVIVAVPCGKDHRCGEGGWIEGPEYYLDANGKEIRLQWNGEKFEEY